MNSKGSGTSLGRSFELDELLPTSLDLSDTETRQSKEFLENQEAISLLRLDLPGGVTGYHQGYWPFWVHRIEDTPGRRRGFLILKLDVESTDLGFVPEDAVKLKEILARYGFAITPIGGEMGAPVFPSHNRIEIYPGRLELLPPGVRASESGDDYPLLRPKEWRHIRLHFGYSTYGYGQEPWYNHMAAAVINIGPRDT